MWEKVVLSAVIFFCTWNSSDGVLTGFPEQKDITTEPSFNCRWLGGSYSSLVCLCQTGQEEFYIKQKSIPSYDVHAIKISNCGTIRFGPNAISDMRNLRTVQLTNINSLIFEEDSLYWLGYTRLSEFLTDYDPNVPSLKLVVENSTISKIDAKAIKGRINRILFNGVVIHDIAPFGFSSLQQTAEVVFDGVAFEALQPQSFKKFTTNSLVIKNCRFNIVPSRAFYDIVVKDEFILVNVSVDVLKPAGFTVNQPRAFEVRESRIAELNGEGFKVTTRGDVLIKDNVFGKTGNGAFRAITVDKEEDYGLMHLYFEGNVFHELGRDALVFDETSFAVKYEEVRLGLPCDCTMERYTPTWQLQCLLDNDWTAVEDFRTRHCSVLRTTTTTIAIVGAVVLSLLVVAIVGVLCYMRKLYRCGSYGESADDKQGKLSMIIPDGRTYRETELHVIVERADLLTTDL